MTQNDPPSEAPVAPREGRIRSYSGRGDLRAWVRVSAVHAALRILRQNKAGNEAPLDEHMERILPDTSSDVELAYLRRRYVTVFNEAIRGALASLTSRDRNLLRYYYIKRLTFTQVGTLYGVHRATVTRWLGDVLETIADAVKSALLRSTRMTNEDVATVTRFVQSQLELNLGEVLSVESA